jgi:membrane-bound lytic murein transglycosylase B
MSCCLRQATLQRAGDGGGTPVVQQWPAKRGRRRATMKIRSMHMLKKWLSGLFLVVMALAFHQAPATAQEHPPAFFKNLQRRLIADGYDPARIKALYQNQEVFFESKGVSLYFLHNEATLDYHKMTQDSWIQEGREYMRQQADALGKAQNEYGVDPKVITAIILVETKFGRYVGTRSIINTLSTIAVLRERKPREYIWAHLPEERRLDRKQYNLKANQKADWAYKELKAFLTYTGQHEIDPVSIKGSYAGALGIAQFMPSNILAYGQDGDGDGRIDLFDDADSIVSIASYLRHFGWKPGIDSRSAYDVVYHYNHSKYYVDTILEIANLLKG